MLEQSSTYQRTTRTFADHADAVHAYAVVQVGPDAAPDVVSETFLVAWRRLDVVPEQPLPWLLATARRVAATHRRGWRRHNRLIDRMAGFAATEPQAMDPAELDGDLWRAMDRLSARERDALLLVTWFDLTNTEAAHVQGCTANAFTVRLHRARRHLRALLDQDDHHQTRHDPASTAAPPKEDPK
ncbi:RNA polymerase sigma-70 factor (ECF subfamily) [Kribbella sp. VKM Ac-2527]|uniref:RNA polymerase sigma-70 factor (ECF subfamily) n=1 Tax=Kribbella caucasensis TaxID=2512215 RepID=A0A4R6IZX1_9ACTN|nr:RNA polymerase sigma factor [Kribbella sp. VKM Ac-2527]TDO27506.1 RNA polymerase sigma-70 factor (ECF subfamily) [Kribbella sp. VKM Ac-2527]